MGSLFTEAERASCLSLSLSTESCQPGSALDNHLLQYQGFGLACFNPGWEGVHL